MPSYYTPFAPFLRRLFCAAAAAALCIAAGCTYKSEIRQGDETLREKIAELRPGMTRDEVLALLGESRTPRVFAGDEWIYYYRLRSPGFFPQTQAWGVALEFEDDLLAVIRPLAAEGAAE